MQNLQTSKNTNNGGDHPKCGNSSAASKNITTKRPRMPPVKNSPSKEKELINCGLHKLVSSFSLVTTKLNRRSVRTIPNKKLDGSPPPLKPNLNPKSALATQANQQSAAVDCDETNQTTSNKKPYKDLQWTNRRLIKKYSQRGKKSRTIPCVDKSDYGSVISDDESDEDGPTNGGNRNTNFSLLLKCLYVLCTASVSFVGSLCGITLITMVLWTTLDHNILSSYFDPPKETYLESGLKLFKAAITRVTDMF